MKVLHYLGLVLLFLKIITTHCVSVQNLGGEWFVSDVTRKYINLKAKVPGGIYTDLMTNNIIGDVLYGNNDTETRWVAKTDWIYKKQFYVDESFLRHNFVNIVFEGVDTFALVIINGIEVGSSRNMFLRYIFNVKKVLQKGNNTIELHFLSPIRIAKKLALKQEYPIPGSCPTPVIRGECHVHQIRKMQASFGWDFGPAVPSMGIWKDVYLEAFDVAVIRSVVVDYEESANNSWMLEISTYLSSTLSKNIAGTFVYKLATETILVENHVVVNVTSDVSSEIKITSSFTVPKSAVRIWWPNGYGEQKLYNLLVEFRTTAEVISKNVTIGFRKIELVQDRLLSGRTFYFKVNNVPIFAKGASVIPIDILPEKSQNRETISTLLESARSANMNMIRVSGTGLYESDYFYEKADELGILIWQDFAFAKVMYPSDPEFLDFVKAEVCYQVQRLSSHPSLAIWSGDSEREEALWSNWYGTKGIFFLYKKDYELLIDTIRTELLRVKKSSLFVSSSPSNGNSSLYGHLKNPLNPLEGTSNYYNYGSDSTDVETIPISRFIIETGYTSFPEIESWMTATDEVSNLISNSIFIDHRNHVDLGITFMEFLQGYQFIDDLANYKRFIFHSQIFQAMSIKFAFEYCRTFMRRLDSTGKGYTMGTLYWSLNDVWMAPTGSSIDYTGRWKMLQYFAKDFFASTIVTGHIDILNKLHVYVVSEAPFLLNSTVNVSVLVEVYKWTSFEPIGCVHSSVTLVGSAPKRTTNEYVEYGKAQKATEIDTSNYLRLFGCGSFFNSRTNCFFYLKVVSHDNISAPPNMILPTTLKYLNFEKTTVQIVSLKELNNQSTTFEITLKTNGISLFVWLNSHQIRGRFSENGFLQIVPLKKIVFCSEDKVSVTVLQKVVTVTHLNNGEV